MFTQIDFEDAAGKTIKAIVRPYSTHIVVAFTDMTYSIIDAFQPDYDEVELCTLGMFIVIDDSYERVFEPLFGEYAKEMYTEACLKDDANTAAVRANAIANGHKF